MYTKIRLPKKKETEFVKLSRNGPNVEGHDFTGRFKYFVSSSSKINTCFMNVTLINICVKLFQIIYSFFFDTINKI